MAQGEEKGEGAERKKKRYFIFRGGKFCQRDRKGEGGGGKKAVGFCPKFRNDVSRFRLLLSLLYAPPPPDNKIQ